LFQNQAHIFEQTAESLALNNQKTPEEVSDFSFLSLIPLQ